MTISSPWAQTLQTASFNGVPFITDGTTYTTGRRVATHSYPYRDNPWIEDLGLQTRNIQFRGFLVGDDVYSQRDALKRACETGGNGTLIHPSMGTITAALVSAGFSESAERGRTVEVSFQFVVSDEKPRWPQADAATQAVTATQVSALNSAASGDFFSQVGGALQSGTSAIGGVLASARFFVGQVTGVMRDAAGIAGSITGGLGLGNVVGRYVGRVTGTVNGVLSGLSGINSQLNGIGSFISSGLGSSVPGGIYGLPSLNLPASTVIGGNFGTVGNLTSMSGVLNTNLTNISSFVSANQTQLSGIVSQGVGAAQQVSQQVGNAINQATAVRSLVTGAANSVMDIGGTL